MLALVALALFVIVLVALAKGQADWARVPPLIWAHLATIMVALALTPYMLLRPRGTPLHRLLGKIWVSAMVATAAISPVRALQQSGPFQHHPYPVGVRAGDGAARVADRAGAQRGGHRGTVRGLVTGALIVAGYFTLLETRLLGHWLFG